MLRHFSYLSIISLWLLLACQSLAAETNYFCTLSNAPLRNAPNLKASPTQLLALGARLIILKKSTKSEPIDSGSAYWLKVRTAGGTQGWISGGMVEQYTSQNLAGKAILLGYNRLQLENPGRTAAFQLVDFLSRIAKQTRKRAPKAELEYLELKALTATIQYVDAHKNPDTKVWLSKQNGRIVEDYAQGLRVKTDPFWELADRYKDLPIGDKLAFAAARHGTGGECEGDPVCIIGRESMTEGAYLQRFPDGLYGAQSITAIDQSLQYVIDSRHAWMDFLKKDTDGYGQAILHRATELRIILRNCKAARKAAPIEKLDRIIKLVSP